jgi:phosphoribosyl-ATP pyrophosphohydrolase
LLIIVKPIKDPNQRRKFNHLIMEQDRASEERKKILSNYDQYVKIHIMAAKRVKPTMTPEASHILEEADIRIQAQKESDGIPNVGSNRGLGVLIRLATVIAKLKLKTEIDVEDAKYAVEFYNTTTADVQSSIKVPDDAGVLACNLIVYILHSESNGLSKSFMKLAEEASTKDPAVKWYLYQGIKNKLGTVSSNRALRRVLEMLENLNSNNIRRVRMQPAEFLWVGQQQGEENGPGGKEEEERVPEKESEETRHDDVYDVYDKGFSTDTGNKGRSDSPKTDTQPKSELSQSSQTSQTLHNKRLEQKEYKVLKAMEMAMANYKDAKVRGKESGSLFEPYDVWYHLFTVFPREQWDIDKVRKVIKEQVKKGNVTTRHGDPPDRYYLIWRDRGTDGDVSVGGNGVPIEAPLKGGGDQP